MNTGILMPLSSSKTVLFDRHGRRGGLVCEGPGTRRTFVNTDFTLDPCAIGGSCTLGCSVEDSAGGPEVAPRRAPASNCGYNELLYEWALSIRCNKKLHERVHTARSETYPGAMTRKTGAGCPAFGEDSIIGLSVGGSSLYEEVRPSA